MLDSDSAVPFCRGVISHNLALAFLCLASFLCAACRHGSVITISTLPTAEQVERRTEGYTSTVLNALRDRGIVVKDSARDAIQTFVRQGASNSDESSPRETLLKFATAVGDEARFDGGSQAVDSYSVTQARLKICPLYPFC